MTKETFVKCIETIKKHRDRENKFLEGLDAVSPETNNDTFIYCDYESLVVDLMIEEMKDKDEVISWWIYDTEFGTNDSFRTLFVEDKQVELDSAEKLYDYLNK